MQDCPEIVLSTLETLKADEPVNNLLYRMVSEEFPPRTSTSLLLLY